MPRVRERKDSEDSVSIAVEDEDADEDECKGAPMPSGDCGVEKSSGDENQDSNDDDAIFKDTTPGRRGRSAYAFYASDATVQAAIQSDNPDRSLAAIRELMRVQWKQMDEAARQPYDDQSISDHHIRKAFEEFDEVRSLLRCVWGGVWCVGYPVYMMCVQVRVCVVRVLYVQPYVWGGRERRHTDVRVWGGRWGGGNQQDGRL